MKASAANLFAAYMFLVSAASAQSKQVPDEVEQAKQVLEEVSRAYSKLPALVDEIKTKFTMTGRNVETSTISVRLSEYAAEATGIVPPMTLSIHAVENMLYLQLKGADGFVEAKLGNNPLAAAESVMGIAFPYLPPQIAMRWMDDDQAFPAALCMGLLTDVTVAGFANTRTGHGRREILLRGSAPLCGGRPGTCRVQFDSNTHLITRIVIDGGTDGNEPTFEMTADFKPRPAAALQKPIVFDANEDADRYLDFQAMLSVALGGGTAVDPSIDIGSKAPDFSLTDHNDKRHTSADYHGKFIVLDWWGSWCLPCRQDLPHVQSLHEKYQDRGDVVFLAMNVRDENDTMARVLERRGVHLRNTQ